MEQQQQLDQQSPTKQQQITWKQIFEDLKEDFKQELINQLSQQYSCNPTQIQVESIDSYLQNMREPNLYLIQSPGYSGKTLAFLIPAIIYTIINYTGEPNHYFVTKKSRGKQVQCWQYHPKVIILADTKYLLQQIYDQIQKSFPESYNKIQSNIIPTGMFDLEEFKFGDILLSSPRILQTLIDSKRDNISLDNCGLLICDEAQIVFEIFQKDIEQILQQVTRNKKCSFIAASSTITQQYIDFVSNIFFQGDSKKRPIKIFTNINLEQVTQYQVMIPQAKDSKQEYQIAFQEIIKLLKYIYNEQKLYIQTMIFLDSIQQIDSFNQEFLKNEEISRGPNKITMDIIHSKLELKKDEKFGRIVVDKQKQNQRLKSIYQNFRDNKFPVLLCTDIMARGIEIRKVGLVIQVFAPRVNSKDYSSNINGSIYMHRIARTGRQNKEGVSLTYLRHNNSNFELPDSQLEYVLNTKVQGLHHNKIESLDIGKDYVNIVAEKAVQAVNYNQDLGKSKN